MIELNIAGGVAAITLNLPEKLNALDEEALAELGERLNEASTADVRALLIRGEGRVFGGGR